MIPFSYPSPRVSQLDAHILDSELFSLLKQNLSSIFALHNSKWWTYDAHSDLWDLLLNLLVFRLTVGKSGSSYGSSLQNLKLVNFRDGRRIRFTKKSCLFALILLEYFYKKVESYLYSIDATRARPTGIKLIDRVRDFVIHHRDKILGKVNSTLKVLNLLNFVLFLVSGRYSSLAYRILGVSMTPIVADLLRFNGDSVNYEFQNRQLVWNVMTEFLVFILPLLQLSKLRRMARKMLAPYKRKNTKEAGRKPVVTSFTSLPPSQCAICYKDKEKALMSGNKKSSSVSCAVTNPYITNCGHIYCYICIASAFNAIEASSADHDGCLRCGLKLTWFKKYGEDENDADPDAIMVQYEEESDEDEQDEKQAEKHENTTENSSSDESEDNESEDENAQHEDDDDYSEGEEIDQEEFEDEEDDFDPDEEFEL